jgi:hypothetical protein
MFHCMGAVSVGTVANKIIICGLWWQGATGRCRELCADGKLGAAETAAIKARTDNVSYAVLAGKYYRSGPQLKVCQAI